MRGLDVLHTPPEIDIAEPPLLPSKYSRLFDVLLVVLLVLSVCYFTLPFGLEHICAEKYDMSIVSGFVLNGAVWFLLLIVCVLAGGGGQASIFTRNYALDVLFVFLFFCSSCTVHNKSFSVD